MQLSKKEKTMNHKIILIIFLFVALIQLAVPAKMIFDSENVITKGKTYKFQLDPVDPNDPFRGKYMTLRFTENEFKVDSCTQSDYTDAYIEIQSGSNGFAKIKNISFDKPSSEKDFFKAQVYCEYYPHFDNQKLDPQKLENKYVVTYPFTKYFMNELGIAATEKKLQELLRDSTIIAYGEVSIKNGQSRLTAIKIDGNKIEDLID